MKKIEQNSEINSHLLAVVLLFYPCVCPLCSIIIVSEQMFMHTGISIWMDGSTEHTEDNTQLGIYSYLK